MLFGATAASIFFAGGATLELTDRGLSFGPFFPGAGLTLMFGILAIVTAHELGHYFACRIHGVDATLPFFLPLPIPGGFGTLGAVIRIRSAFPNRQALFDIGIAGPLAGFLVSVPVLVLAGLEARAIYPLPGAGGTYFGDPLLLQWVLGSMLGPLRADAVVAIGPMGMAAWFGLFLTALNLLPIGQLDGGHIVYALTPRWAALVSRFGWWVCVGLIYFGPNWLVWAVLLRFLGRRHPPTLDDTKSLGRGRNLLALIAVAVFVMCFVPNPLVGSWSAIYAGLREMIPALPALGS